MDKEKEIESLKSEIENLKKRIDNLTIPEPEYKMSDYYKRVGKGNDYYLFDSSFDVYSVEDDDYIYNKNRFDNMNYFKTEVEAKKYRDYYKLFRKIIECRDFVNDGWTPDWNFYPKELKIKCFEKYVIYLDSNEIKCSKYCNLNYILAFETEAKRDLFRKIYNR